MRLNATSATVRDALRSAKAAVVDLEVTLREVQKAEREERRSQVQLTNRMRIAGWVGPAGWRLQTYEAKKVKCACCDGQIFAGEQHVGWCMPTPLVDGKDTTGDALDRYRRFAHPECLRKLGAAMHGHASAIVGIRIPDGLRFVSSLVHTGISALPAWRAH